MIVAFNSKRSLLSNFWPPILSFGVKLVKYLNIVLLKKTALEIGILNKRNLILFFNLKNSLEST